MGGYLDYWAEKSAHQKDQKDGEGIKNIPGKGDLLFSLELNIFYFRA